MLFFPHHQPAEPMLIVKQGSFLKAQTWSDYLQPEVQGVHCSQKND